MLGVFIIVIIALNSQHVQSKVITVNTSKGNDSTKCCVDGGEECPCSSLPKALQNMDNNTIINITSEAITLDDNITIGSGNLNNITITSHVATITCSSNDDVISCDSCDDVIVSGISWYNCSLELGNSSVIKCSLEDVKQLVSGSIRIEQSVSSYSEIYNVHHIGYVNLTILNSTFYTLNVSDSSCSAEWNITILNSTFMAESVAYAEVDICADVWHGIHMVDMVVSNFLDGFQLRQTANKQTNINVSVLSSVFIGNLGNALRYDVYSLRSNVSVLISDTEFTGVVAPGDRYESILSLSIITDLTSTITLKNLNFTNNSLNVSFGIIYIEPTSCIVVNMTKLNFIANKYHNEQPFGISAAVYIKTKGILNRLVFNQCKFINNTFSHGAKMLYFDAYADTAIIVDNCSICNNTILDGKEILHIGGHGVFNITISNTVFSYNVVDDHIIVAESYSVVVSIIGSKFIANKVKRNCIYLSQNSLLGLVSSQFINNTVNCVSGSQAIVILVSVNFTGNTGSCIRCSQCDVTFNKYILFDSNTADKGAALYMNYGTTVSISDGSTIEFLQNSASLGGAIFVDLSIDCLQYGVVFSMMGNAEVTLKDNIAKTRYGGDAMYFTVSKSCKIHTNTTDPRSLMNIPYHFNYSELNSTKCCNVNCSNLNTIFPVITSPRYLLLCGDNIKQLDNVTYFIDNIALGKPVVFKGNIMDYFKKLAQFVQFNLRCTTCPSNIKLSSNYILVDNTSPLSLSFSGDKINFNVNVTIMFTSVLDAYIYPIEVEVIVELVPCFTHIGYAYSKANNGCACYQHSVVKCSDHYNEIKDDYWIGAIFSQPTTSLCPAHYCSFIHRNKFTLGYSELPNTVDAQCNNHRMGRACGKCSSGYTLAYDTSDCISVNHCSTVISVVVIVSTCLYWLIIVVGVFMLLYFNRHVPLGYTYGIIYYYSMVGILFSNNLYVSESAFVFISVMSSFTQLSPQFLGQLCLVEGLSGIDQLFIHYSHPVAVSLLVVVFVFAAKFSRKLSNFVSRSRIIRIICLLLLLSYTSISSTSLQLLRPLMFTDIDEVYTYSSPSIQYFHDRHALYGIVAVVCESVVGIGLPLLLLLEPFVNKKINFVRIKPFLDEFQDCYKEKRKYRWFASYYLICRQVILLTIFVGSSNYDGMLFFLQTTCIVIATIHMWVQPYKSASLNIFDGLILQTMVVSVAVNSFAFLQPAATELVLVLVLSPIFVICIIGIRGIIERKLRRGQYTELPGDNDRFVLYL